MENIKLRLSLILTTDDMRRLTFKDKEGEKKIICDLHGMKCKQARRFLNNILNIIRTAVELIIVHGFNHGTAIKDMILGDFYNEHICLISPDIHNMGVTHILTN